MANPRRDDPQGGGRDEAPTLTLSSALKLAGFAETGGQAKGMIQGGDVLVNGEVETRRKRRLREGDEITVDDETFVIELDEGDEEAGAGDGLGEDEAGAHVSGGGGR